MQEGELKHLDAECQFMALGTGSCLEESSSSPLIKTMSCMEGRVDSSSTPQSLAVTGTGLEKTSSPTSVIHGIVRKSGAKSMSGVLSVALYKLSFLIVKQ